MKKVSFASIIILFFSVLLFTTSCTDEDDKVTETEVTLKFTFNWDGTPVTMNDLNEMKYTNENGDELSISRLRYLISNISLNAPRAMSETNEYSLVDITDSESLEYKMSAIIATEAYENISFTFGFDEEDNVETYVDLNSASWNWPEMLGAGYHNMQYEGKYIDNTGLEQSYALHMGTARKDVGVFEANSFDVELTGIGSLHKDKVSIEIKMDISEWYKNPTVWDLNVYNAPVMPIYAAQLLLNDNGRDVFSLGEVIQ